ncbi:Fanconi anemia group I protein [Patella vulgata]|uniref:Fanconi anemia group I protein n=1 Tax=Patella vulgata TaxID=6465 RepID=UPI0024A7B3D4|nr:Fanconi anemia group I protein [Patella vulgata]
MDKQILLHYEKRKYEELAKILKSKEFSEIKELLDNYVLRGRTDPTVLVLAVLTGLYYLKEDGKENQLLIYKYMIKVLQKNEINIQTVSNLVGLLMLEADKLGGANLVELASQFTESVKNGTFTGGKAVDLFPKILYELSKEDKVIYGDGSMRGSECKNHILNTLCSGRWNPTTVVHLAAMFIDVPMTSEELKFVIEKIIRSFPEMALQDLPALVYQLLLLAKRGHKRLVIEGVTSFYIDKDTVCRNQISEITEDLMSEECDTETLRYTEGTVILHIVFSVKQDQELGREFIRYLKNTLLVHPVKVLAPFNLALALSVARIHRLQDQLYDFIKSTILKSFKDKDKENNSKWIRELVPDTVDITSYVLETVDNSKYGWDHVLQGLVQLGFTLMDSCGPKSAFGKEIYQATIKTPSQFTCQLGKQVLKNTVKVHEVVRLEILDQIFNRIVTKATQPISHYLDLLSDIVSSSPHFLLEAIPKVKEAFDYLSYLPTSSGQGLLTAIQPLLKLSTSLKDTLLIVLRKAMFSRQLDPRKIGVYGYLMILKHFKVLGGLPSSQCSQPFNLSQVQIDVHTRYNPASNEAVCIEILGNLRRVGTQQADVRLQLYEGFYEVVHRNTQLQMPVLDNLLNQLTKFYVEDEEINPPVLLDKCILPQGEQVFLAEPLAHLLACIQHIVIKTRETLTQQHTDDDDDDEEEEKEDRSLILLEQVLADLTVRMISSEMEDFEIDKSADFTLKNTVGIKNNIFAILVLGIYEVLMEYNFIHNKNSVEKCEKVLKLYEKYVKLSDLLKEKASTANGKKGKVSTSKPSKAPASLFSLSFNVDIVTLLLTDFSAKHKTAYDVLRTNLDFMKHIVTTAVNKLHQYSDKGVCDGSAGLDKSKLMNHCCQLGKLFLVYYIEHQMTTDRNNKTIVSGCLDGLLHVFTICTTDKDKLCQCLKALEDYAENEKWSEKIKTEKIHKHIKKLQRLVANIFTTDEDKQNIKEVGSLLSIIGQLSKYLPYHGTEYEEVQIWIHKICTDQTIDDIPTCKQVLSTLLTITQQMTSVPQILKDMCQDVHSQLGDVDQQVEVEDKTNFSLITIRTAAPTVLQLTLHHIDRELDDMDWVIGYIKSDTSISQSGDDLPNATQQETREKSICSRYGVIIVGYYELVQSALPSGICTDIMLKSLTKLYTSLSVLVKYYISLYTKKTGHLTSRFEKLIKLIGSKLSPCVYAFITYIQALEKEHIQQAADHIKTKKDKKKPVNTNIPTGKVIKQTKMIPNLIYAIEVFEKFLIQLTKKSKVNLMDNVKMSTARDFRINKAAVQAVLDEQSDSSSSNSDEDPTQDVENDQDNHGDDDGEKENNSGVEDSDGDNDNDSDEENQSSVSNTPSTSQQDPQVSTNKRDIWPSTSQHNTPPNKKAKLGSKVKNRR